MKSIRWLLGVILFCSGLVLASAISLYFFPTSDVPLFVSLASSVIAAFGSFSAWFAVREMQIDRAERNRPWVLVDFPIDHGSIVYFRIRNLGPGSAKNVRMSFVPDPIAPGGHKLTQDPLFQQPIPVLVPGAEIRLMFSAGPRLLQDDVPKRFDVTVEYEGDAGISDKSTYAVDFEQLQSTLLPPRTTEEALEEINGTLRNIQYSCQRVAEHTARQQVEPIPRRRLGRKRLVMRRNDHVF